MDGLSALGDNTNFIQIFSKTSTNLSSQNNFCTQHALSRIYKTFCSLEEIKVPVGVKHAYEKVLFDNAYPEFRAWVTSNGADNAVEAFLLSFPQ